MMMMLIVINHVQVCNKEMFILFGSGSQGLKIVSQRTPGHTSTNYGVHMYLLMWCVVLPQAHSTYSVEKTFNIAKRIII